MIGHMDSLNNILLCIASILGTLLAILSAFSNDQKDTSELLTKDLLVGLSKSFSKYNSNSVEYAERFYKIKTDITSYRYAYKSFLKLYLKLKTTNKYCLCIGKSMLMFLELSLLITIYSFTKNTEITFNEFSILALVTLLITTKVFLYIWDKFLYPFIMHLVPYTIDHKYPTPNILLKPVKELYIANLPIIKTLPLSLLAAGSIVEVYNINSDNNPYTLEFDIQNENQDHEYQSIAVLRLSVLYYFSGELIFNLKFKENRSENKIIDTLSYKISNSTKDIKYKNSIFFKLTESKDNIESIALKLTKDNNPSNNILIYYHNISGTNIFTPKYYVNYGGTKFTATDKIEFKEPEKKTTLY